MAETNSPLLKLPGELRNLIYGYVLHSQTLVHPASVFTTQRTPNAVYAGSGVPDMYTGSQGQSLRTYGWTVSKKHGRWPCIDSKFQALNQLQHVNKQLRAETAGLVFKHSIDNLGIERSQRADEPPSLQLYVWMASVEPKQLAKLGQFTITLSDAHLEHHTDEPVWISDTVETMDGLCRLLKACPNITVKYIVRNWTIPYNSPTIHSISKFKELVQEYILSFVHPVPQHLDGWLADAPDSQTKGEHLKDNLRKELMAR